MPAFILGLVLSQQEKHIMKRCVWRLNEEGIRLCFPGIKEYVSYGEIREALRNKKIKITAAYKIPKKRGYITFHYEVGNDEAQKMALESYKFLMKELNVEIPRLSLKVIRQMDRLCLRRRRPGRVLQEGFLLSLFERDLTFTAGFTGR